MQSEQPSEPLSPKSVAAESTSDVVNRIRDLLHSKYSYKRPPRQPPVCTLTLSAVEDELLTPLSDGSINNSSCLVDNSENNNGLACQIDVSDLIDLIEATSTSAIDAAIRNTAAAKVASGAAFDHYIAALHLPMLELYDADPEMAQFLYTHIVKNDLDQPGSILHRAVVNVLKSRLEGTDFVVHEEHVTLVVQIDSLPLAAQMVAQSPREIRHAARFNHAMHLSSPVSFSGRVMKVSEVVQRIRTRTYKCKDNGQACRSPHQLTCSTVHHQMHVTKRTAEDIFDFDGLHSDNEVWKRVVCGRLLPIDLMCPSCQHEMDELVGDRTCEPLQVILMAMDNAGINLNTSSVVIVASFDLINRAKVGDAIHVIGVPLIDEDYALQKVPKLKSLMKTHELLNWTEMIGFHPGMYVKALGISPTIYMNSHDYIAQIGVQCEGNVDSLELIMSVFDDVVPRSLFGHFKLAMLMSMVSVHAQYSENAHPIGLLILATKSTEHIVGKLVDRALQLSWKQKHQRGQRVSSDCIRVINAFNCNRMSKASEPGTKWYIAHRCSEAAFKAVESGEHILVVDMVRWTHEAEEAVANHIMVYAMVDHAVNSVEPSRKLFERAAAINVAMTDVAGTILQDYFANIREQQEHQNGQNIAQGWLGLMTMLISASEAHARLQSNSRVTAGDARAAVAMMQASAAAANAVAPRG